MKVEELKGDDLMITKAKKSEWRKSFKSNLHNV